MFNFYYIVGGFLVGMNSNDFLIELNSLVSTVIFWIL